MHRRTHHRFALAVTALAGLVLAVAPVGSAMAGSGTVAQLRGSGTAKVLSTIVAGPLAAPRGFAPTQIRNVYGFNAMGNDARGTPINGQGQIIGIVLWDSDPYLQSDVAKFLKTYSYLEPMNGLHPTHIPARLALPPTRRES